MLLFMPAAVMHVRYVIDVEMVLLFVAFSGGLVDPLAEKLERIGQFWIEQARSLKVRLERGRNAAETKAREGIDLRPTIIVSATVLVIMLAVVSFRRNREFEDIARALDAVPKGSLLLADFDLQFQLLFVRPDLRLVPSCEIGYPSQEILPEYRRFVNEGAPCELAKAIGAEWFVGQESPQYDPLRATCLGVKEGRAKQHKGPAIALWRIGPG
jgi:hypothetical protein